MNADQYLLYILSREAVDYGPQSPVRGVMTYLNPIIAEWASTQLHSITPSGSFAKGTANLSGTDIDLFISLKSDTTQTLKEIYNGLADRMTFKGYASRKQNVSINVKVGVYSVDLVPAKRQDNMSSDHSLYRRRADTWTKTNVAKHIAHVQAANRRSETRILKLWRNQNGLDFPSFYLELAVINALYGRQSNNLSANVVIALQYFSSNFLTARIVDPANTNNIISDDMTASERKAIATAAELALLGNWESVVK